MCSGACQNGIKLSKKLTFIDKAHSKDNVRTMPKRVLVCLYDTSLIQKNQQVQTDFKDYSDI